MGKGKCNSQIYTIGFCYKCGKCGKGSKNFQSENTMLMWKRLHFKKNPACKKRHDTAGLGDGYNNTFVDDMGKKHNTGYHRNPAMLGEYKIPKSSGHNKKNKEYDTSDDRDVRAYLKKAKTNKGYQEQMIRDMPDGWKGNLEMDWDMPNMATPIIRRKIQKARKKGRKNKKK